VQQVGRAYSSLARSQHRISFFRAASCLFIIISRLTRGHCIVWMIPPLP
jgi:hypothetical protein